MITRFALLRHEVPDDFGRPSHWDLLLEREDACYTWALKELPGRLAEAAEPVAVDAQRLQDHRKHYLEYEGLVSGDRGFVRRELEGDCRWLEVSDGRIRAELSFVYDKVEVVLEQIAEELWRLTVQ